MFGVLLKGANYIVIFLRDPCCQSGPRAQHGPIVIASCLLSWCGVIIVFVVFDDCFARVLHFMGLLSRNAQGQPETHEMVFYHWRSSNIYSRVLLPRVAFCAPFSFFVRGSSIKIGYYKLGSG